MPQRVLLNLCLMLIIALISFDRSFAENLTIPGEALQAEGNGNWQKAINIYLDVLMQDPSRVDLWLRIASIEHHLKNTALAINAYKHAIAIQPNNPKLYKSLSELYSEINQPQKALATIKEATKLEPNNTEYIKSEASIANWSKDIKSTLDSYQKLLSMSQNTNQSISLLIQIGDLQSQLHNYQDAINSYNKAIQASPNNPILYSKLALTYSLAKQPKNALDAISHALLLEPNNLKYLKSKAIFATWLKDNKLALETYTKILVLSPNDKEALQNIKKIKSYLASPGKTVELKPLSPLERLIALADNESSKHQYESAANYIKKAIELKPNDATLYKKLSETYSVANQPKLAFAAIDNAVRLDPKNIEYLRARGKLASWTDNKIEMEKSYERILQLNPCDEDALLNLAKAFGWQGKIDATIATTEHLLRLYPKNAAGWIEYAEALSWVQNYICSLNALNHYRQLKGVTQEYCKTKARILALIGYFRSSLAVNEPLLQKEPKDSYLLTTEIVALNKSLQINSAISYLNWLNKLYPDDNQVQDLNKFILTPLRSNINLEGDYLTASDTTTITDLPFSAQYFLNSSTSILIQGLYERLTANPNSGLETITGNGSIFNESLKVGFTKQIPALLNLKLLVGNLKIQNENNHALFDILINTNLDQTAQLTIESFRDLYKPYLVAASPKCVSLQIMENRNSLYLQWQPLAQRYLNILTSYSSLSDANHYWHINVWPKSRIYGSEHWLVTVGLNGDFWRYEKRPNNGYYSPLFFNGYEGTVELYYGQSSNLGFSIWSGFGLQKDETYHHYFYEEDIGAQAIYNIDNDWQFQVKGGYTLRDNPGGNYHSWSGGLVLTRKF